MKLNKLKFALVVGFVQLLASHRTLNSNDIEDLDSLIDINMPEAPKADAALVNELLRLMAEGQRKIEAIKTYRSLTGAGLREAKEQVEKHWASKPIIEANASPTHNQDKYGANQDATLGDILAKATK